MFCVRVRWTSSVRPSRSCSTLNLSWMTFRSGGLWDTSRRAASCLTATRSTRCASEGLWDMWSRLNCIGEKDLFVKGFYLDSKFLFQLNHSNCHYSQLSLPPPPISFFFSPSCLLLSPPTGGFVDSPRLQHRVQQRLSDLRQCFSKRRQARSPGGGSGCSCGWGRGRWGQRDGHPHLQRALVRVPSASRPESRAPPRLLVLPQNTGDPLAVHYQLTGAGGAAPGLCHYHPHAGP